MKEPEVGDNVFSKNGIEFNCAISSINGNKITVEYNDNYVEECTINRSDLKPLDDEWEVPNWTISLEQL